MQKELSNWYVVHTCTGDETKIYKTAHGGAETVYMPLKEVLHKRGDTFIKKRGPLFPGYLFVQEHIANFVDNVRQGDLDVWLKPLGQQGKPLPVKKEEMEFIFKLAENGVVGVSKGYMAEDGKVQIVEGPMKGMEADILFVDKRRKKAKVQFELFNRRIDVTLALEIL